MRTDLSTWSTTAMANGAPDVIVTAALVNGRHVLESKTQIIVLCSLGQLRILA